MINKTHYEGYSFALLELSIKSNKMKAMKQQAEMLITVFETQPEYLKLLSSYDIDFPTKEKLLTKAFKKKIDTILYRILFILIQKNRINSIINILSLYVNQINKINQTHEGVIYSVEELSSEEILKIEKTTEKRLGHKVVLTNIIDATITAGFKIIINDIVIDATILNQLEMMKQEIIKNNIN